MGAIEEFFARYEKGSNSFDPDLMSSLYTDEQRVMREAGLIGRGS
jgi:hypothetical protein